METDKESLDEQKLDMLRKLQTLVKFHDVRLSRHYNINSDLIAMKYEYQLHKNIIDKQKREEAVIGLFNETIRAVCHNLDQSTETIEQLIKNTGEGTINDIITNIKTRSCNNN